MIRFTERNLQVPALQRRVYLVTGGLSHYARAYPDKLTEELCIEAFQMAAKMLGMAAEELKGYIHSAYYGHFADHFGCQLLGEATIHDRLGLDPLGNIGVKTGGATGGSTIWEAVKAVASGYSNCVLAMGWERMDTCPTDEGNNLIANAADISWETELGHLYGNYYALMAQRYWQIFGQKEESFRHVLAQIAARNHTYAYHNPFSQTHKKRSVEDVLTAPMITAPFRALDFCLMSAGASCVVVADEATAMEMIKKHTDCKVIPLVLDIAAGSHTLRTADRRDMDIPLLPFETAEQYADLGERFPGGDRYPGFTGFLAARMAAYYLYRSIGVTNPREDFQAFEDHDAFTISTIQTIEDVGFSAYGEGRTYIESGDAFHGGICPNNVSGGLMGFGHPVGSTGIGQVVMNMFQINGIFGGIMGDETNWANRPAEPFTKPEDWEDLQIPECRRALAISHAGVGSHVTCCSLQHPDHVLEGRVSA